MRFRAVINLETRSLFSVTRSLARCRVRAAHLTAAARHGVRRGPTALALALVLGLAVPALAVTYYATYKLNGGSATQTGQTYTASAQDTSGVWVTSSGTLTLNDCVVTTSGSTSSNDNSSFYGLNAGVLASQGTITMNGGSVTTTGTGGNAIFAYGSGSQVTASNVTIDASAGGGHGIMCSGGGKITATNLDMTTRGANSGVIATDRGGGTIIVTGGTVLATGQDSPGIYSTGDIRVTGATISATGAESAVIEGANSITLTNTSLSSSKADKWGVMIYQSMSGDAQGNQGVFTMTGGSLANTATTGPLFFVNNTTAVITLKGVAVSAGSGTLVEAGASRWGTSGKNGGTVVLTADAQALTGNFVTDDTISSITATLKNGSALNGTVDTAALSLDGTSSWHVTGASKLSSLTSAGTISGTGTVTATTATVQSGTVAAVLAGSGTLSKTTSGTATLSGANTFTGATTVSAGTLNLTGSLASSAVTVSSGASLAGTGTMSGHLTVASGASLVLGSSGHVGVGGNVALGGTITVVPAVDPLPAGSYTLLSYSGSLSGTPSFTYASPSGQVASVSTATSGKVTVTIGSSSLAISTSATLPGGKVGASYSVTLEATGGTTPYTWSVESGSLPGGLALSTAGVVSGTPMADGSFSFVAKVTDHASSVATKGFSLTVAAADLAITTGATLPQGQVGASYSATLEATGGMTPYTWSVESGSLPDGLALSTAGVVSGTPTAAGSFELTVLVADSGGLEATGTFTVEIVAEVLFPGVASQPGWNGTEWRSELELFNPHDEAHEVTLVIVERGSSTVVAEGTVTVEAGQIVRIEDLYGELGAPSGAGMLRVAGPVLSWVRTYNQRSDGTLGQDVPRLVPAEAFAAGRAMVFPLSTPAELDTDFRSNLVLVNPGAAEVTCTLVSGSHTQQVAVPAGSYVQVNNVGASMGLASGTAVLHVTGTGAWSGYVSTIDPALGDPTTVLGLSDGE